MINPQKVINHAEGDHYEGGYKNGTYHGQGSLTLADGTTYKGSFEEGKFQRQEN